MKTLEEVGIARNNIDENSESRYNGMTYEQGLAEALDWVAGHIDDGKFEPLVSMTGE